MKEIITVTLNTALDCVISEREFEVSGIDSESLKTIPAGKGLNVSKALASHKEFSICIGFVGLNDKVLFDSISNTFISTDFIYVPGKTRKNITISECKDGLEHHECNPGFTISKEEKIFIKNTIFSHFSPERVIIFSGSLPSGLETDTYKELILEAKENGLITVLDSSSFALKEGIKAGPYIIKPNLEELQSLAGKNLSLDNDLKDFIRELSRENGIEYVLTTLSEKGAILYIRRKDSFIETGVYCDDNFKDRPIISSVGCGDSSLAGFVYGLKMGLSDKEALELAMKWAFLNLYTEIPGDLTK